MTRQDDGEDRQLRAGPRGEAQPGGEANGPPLPQGVLGATRYGEVLAHVVHFAPAEQGEVLARLGITAGQWSASQTHWTKQLAADLKKGDLDQATAFAQAFAQHQERLAEAKPALASLGPLPARAGQGAAGPGGEALRSSAPVPSVDETVLGVAVVLSDPLPFRSEPAAAVRARLQAQACLPLPPSDPTGETQEVSAVLASRPVLPFAPAAALPTPNAGQAFPALTIEQYASLRAEICERPERTDEIIGRYGVHSAAALMALEAEWSRRRSAEPATAARLDELVRSYRAWLRQQGGGSR